MTLAELIAVLQQRREAIWMSQLQLAAALGCQQSDVSSWEHHHRRPNAVTLTSWAAVLLVDVPAEVLAACRQPCRCGTDSGYNKHRRTGTVPCAACREAHNMVQKAWRRARKERS